jgi:GNAT superfamily N-acetyltransferase
VNAAPEFSVQADSWLAEVMARPVFRVAGGGDADAVGRHLVDHPGFYFAKVATDCIADVSSLSRLGFTVVDTNVTFELGREPQGPPGFDVGPMADGETDAVLDIAGSAFRYSRFHLDPLVGDPLAHRIKREWIRNYALRVRGDALLVARMNGRPCGFLAALIANDTAVIDLVAVATEAHGKGAGAALTAAFAERYRGKRRIVGTQVANVPSIRLYTKLGFTLANSQYVLHHHVG